MRKVKYKNIFIKRSVEEVFTPSTVAKLTYVRRSTTEKDFLKNLNIPGMQLIIYGNSGSGKTTLVRNLLIESNFRSIKTSCTSTTTFEKLTLNAFDELNAFYTEEKSYKRNVEISSELKSKFFELRTSLRKEYIFEDNIVQRRLISVQLTPQRLSEFLGAIKCVWIIEDFHKMLDQEKTKLSQVLKVFMDNAYEYPSSKIICIGAVATARELINLDNELNNRVAEIFVPLLNSDELRQIIIKGFNILNINVHEDNILRRIIHYSNNLASVCHQLCLDICYCKNIKKSLILVNIIYLDDFNEAVKSFIRKFSDTFNRLYEKICSHKNYKEYITELIESDDELFNATENISGRIIPKHKLIERKNILENLCTYEYGEILRFNPDAEKYSFSNPFFLAFFKMKISIEKAEKQRSEEKKNLELFSISSSLKEGDLTKYIFELLEKDSIDYFSIEKNTSNPTNNDKNFQHNISKKNLKYETKHLRKRKGK